MILPDFFLRLMEFVLHWEGLAYTGGRNDKGGATKFGVSLRFLKGLPVLEGDLDGDGAVTWKDVFSMTREQALDLFWRHFGQPLYVGAWPSPLAAVLLDTGVNCGRGSAVRWAQAACNGMGEAPAPLLVDGVLGQKTRAALCAACRLPGGPDALARAVIAARKAHYDRLNATGDPDYTVNHKGWMRRVASLEAFVAGRPWRMEDKPWERTQAA
ncbi:hypothetical protein NNJEOMEG_03315 [Fundidesulfovibrio magnetotacticus]|uniref:Secretion activating protein n=1 Tax=Fundidesulfovibrio magnetotacticus TaxID=2730080 RepID=A0A6V8LSJ7_9BACT|nr:glycosyl hydrolase 108 family protein [Fundidesulfovibrio magnetotacticus]GFK95452.1 hypothetical protein NNJEOMEG_03315 [Fundidesulfovibrio magnetotacticus]